MIGGENTATSSIIENIRVNNPRALEEYAAAMEESAKNFHKRTEAEYTGLVTDKAETKAFMQKALEKKGIKL